MEPGPGQADGDLPLRRLRKGDDHARDDAVHEVRELVDRRLDSQESLLVDLGELSHPAANGLLVEEKAFSCLHSCPAIERLELE